jgi:hypothetical protein
MPAIVRYSGAPKRCVVVHGQGRRRHAGARSCDSRLVRALAALQQTRIDGHKVGIRRGMEFLVLLDANSTLGGRGLVRSATGASLLS